jgi:hypothetical protein
MITYTDINRSGTIIKLQRGDRGFQITDGILLADRASLEITQDCPENMRDILALAYQHGWIKPVAHITEREKIFIGLTQ